TCCIASKSSIWARKTTFWRGTNCSSGGVNRVRGRGGHETTGQIRRVSTRRAAPHRPDRQNGEPDRQSHHDVPQIVLPGRGGGDQDQQAPAVPRPADDGVVL